MAEETYYRKVGRRYKPVSYYDPGVCDSFPVGAHLVIREPSSTLRRYNVDPNVAGLLAAALMIRDPVIDAIHDASSLQPSERQPLTPEQHSAWVAFEQAMGDDLFAVSTSSAQQIAEAATEALQREFDRMITNPNARAAFDQFLTVYQLTKE